MYQKKMKKIQKLTVWVVISCILIPFPYLQTLAQQIPTSQLTAPIYTSETYKILPGDNILITSPGVSEIYIVDKTGKINHTRVGTLKVYGYTPKELEDYLSQPGVPVKVYILSTPEGLGVITGGRAGPIIPQGVTVGGEVQLPGIYPPGRLLDVLAAARWFTWGYNGRCVVYHRNEKPIIIKTSDILNFNKFEQNVLLQPGDFVWAQKSSGASIIDSIGKLFPAMGTIASVIIAYIQIKEYTERQR